MIDDAALPGLRNLAPPVLARLTGQPDASLLRLRYRQGRKAILHVGSAQGEGVVWLYAGGKGRRVARRNPQARFDPETGAVFEAFPRDHRLPEIEMLTQAWPSLAPELIGDFAVDGLSLLRYRPGLAATFQTKLHDGTKAFVKVVGDENVEDLASSNRVAQVGLNSTVLRIAPVLGFRPDHKAIGYAMAEGESLDQILRRIGGLDRLEIAMDRLCLLGKAQRVTTRRLTVENLHHAARASSEIICTVFPDLAGLVGQTLARLDSTPKPAEHRLLHGDMKLEHVFLNGSVVTLIDTETMAVGPADYDLAMLWGRVAMDALDGVLQSAVAQEAQKRISVRAGQGFDWCRSVVALRLGKFHAEHPAPDARERATRLMQALA